MSYPAHCIPDLAPFDYHLSRSVQNSLNGENSDTPKASSPEKMEGSWEDGILELSERLSNISEGNPESQNGLNTFFFSTQFEKRSMKEFGFDWYPKVRFSHWTIGCVQKCIEKEKSIQTILKTILKPNIKLCTHTHTYLQIYYSLPFAVSPAIAYRAATRSTGYYTRTCVTCAHHQRS